MAQRPAPHSTMYVFFDKVVTGVNPGGKILLCDSNILRKNRKEVSFKRQRLDRQVKLVYTETVNKSAMPSVRRRAGEKGNR